MEDTQNPQLTKDDSLEGIETIPQNTVNQPANQNPATTNVASSLTADEKTPTISLKRGLFERLQAFVNHINIYLLLFLLLILLTGIAGFASYNASKNTSQSNIVNQTLSTADLSSLVNNETAVGDSTQVLTIASNSIFNGQVLIRNNLDVAGTINVGSSVSFTNIAVSGTSAFTDLQVGNDFSVSGNTFVQGILTAQGGLTVNGSGSFSGGLSAASLSVNQLTLNQNLQLNRHIEAGGSTPGIYAGTAVGSGGTVSINGSDTAGTITINFGSGPVVGILANITFTNSFNQTPHIVITPIGSNCAALSYYANRTTTGFAIGTANAGSAGVNCSFDYIAID